jgi:hypothetical protein
MGWTEFTDLSQDFSDSQFTSIFSNTGLSGSTNLSSLSAESSEMVRFVRYKLGEPKLTVELDNSQIIAAFEESNLEYSRILHTIQISNNFATMFGLNRDYDNHDLKNQLPAETFSFLRKYTQNFGAFSDTPVGGTIEKRKGYLETVIGQQDYNIFSELTDEQSSKTLAGYINSSSLSANNALPKISKLYHYPQVGLFRYFDPWSNMNVLNQSFQFESYTLGGQYYLMPVWNDILRGQIFKQSDLVRRSNFSYNFVGNTLSIFPTPRNSFKIWFDWYLDPDPFNPLSALTGSASGQAIQNKVNALWNVPISDIKYEEMNPVARQWIRQYTVAVCKEMLGLIRNKFASVPIPNGDVTLNGSDLVQQGREDMSKLKEELRTELEQFKKENLMEKEAKMMEMTYNQLKFFPLGGPTMG